MEVNEYGYITDLSVEEAIKIFDDMYLTLSGARGNGKSRMLYNYTRAWVEIRVFLEKQLQKQKEVN